MTVHRSIVNDCLRTLKEVEKDGDFHKSALQLARWIQEAGSLGKMVVIFGNGGSAADAQHWAAELVCTYENRNRPAISAIALTTDTSVLTAWANDASFDDVFSRQIRAHANYTHLAIGMSTSGKSINVVQGLKTADEYGIKTVLISGNTPPIGCYEKYECHIRIPSSSTPVVQTVTQVLYHQVCHELDTNALPTNEEQH